MCGNPRARRCENHFAARAPMTRAVNPCLARDPQHETAGKTAQQHCPKKALTFDMSGGPKGAKRPLERPLDGRVR